MKPAENRTTLAKRVAASIGLSIYFLIIYGSCLAVSAGRANVPSFYFPWEHRIPFVAAMVVPYLSIDLFFITAPLLIAGNRQLRAHCSRVLLAISLAGFFFLVLPLKFAFTRPQVHGWVGQVFDQFQRADRPFNQLPSLHVALLVIVGDVFLRKTRGAMRTALVAWFCLIAASPLLVYQHHLADLVAGLALGLICVTLINADSERIAFDRSIRVGFYYFAAAMVIVGISVWIGRASWPLWWPGLSLALVAVGYFFVGPAIFAKRDGRLPVTTRLLYWPTLLGQAASRRWYARFSRPYDALTPRLWIGRLLSSAEAAAARDAGVGAVIDLTCEFDEPPAFQALSYLNLQTLDLSAPTAAQIARAVVFIREHETRSIVYLHCKAGYSRTAVIAAAYLLATARAATVDEAIAQLRTARPAIVIRSEARRAINRFELSLWQDGDPSAA